MNSPDLLSSEDEKKRVFRDFKKTNKHPYGQYTYYYRKLSFLRKFSLFALFLLPLSFVFYLVYRKVFSDNSILLLFIAGQLIVVILFFIILKGAKQIAFDEREIVIGDFKASRIVTVYFFILPFVVFIGLLFQDVSFSVLFMAGAAVAIGYYIHFKAGKKYFSTDQEGNIIIKKHGSDLTFNIREIKELKFYFLPRMYKNIFVPKKVVFVLSNGQKENIPHGSIRSLRLHFFIPPIFMERYFLKHTVSAGFKIQPMNGKLFSKNGWIARNMNCN